MHETVDVTKVWEVPMMDVADWNAGIEFFAKVMIREPFPEEQLSLAQMPARLEILRCGVCYAD